MTCDTEPNTQDKNTIVDNCHTTDIHLEYVIMKVNKKSRYEPSTVAHEAVRIFGFCSMKQLEVFLLFPGWDDSPLQGYPWSTKFAGTHLYTWCESQVSCPRTQCNVCPRPRLNLDFSI